MHANGWSDELIRGQSVDLRELSRPDVDEMARWPRFEEPDLQWANLELTSPRDRDNWYERGRSNSSRRRFSVIDRHNRVVGTVGLRNIDYHFGEGTLGIIMSADAVNQGYGTDVITTLVRYAFERMGLRKIYLDVAEDNRRAQRCYEKCGFTTFGQHNGSDGIAYIDMVITRDCYRQMEIRALAADLDNVTTSVSARSSSSSPRRR
ncbi:MAG TPA: GNAT family protein [Chloroflexota bacterium]|nr:GNAT family protein [Chloroflexota bacterium]